MGNSTVTEGSISFCNNSYEGSIYQHHGKINITAVNFSKCQTRVGSAIYCNWVDYENVNCCYIDSCHATEFSAVYFEYSSAKLKRSNIINNTHTDVKYGIIHMQGFCDHTLYIEDCIFQNNCQNNNATYFFTQSYSDIFIFRTICDKTIKACKQLALVYMSEMTTSPFENDFFICLTPEILIKINKQKTKSVFDTFLYVHLFYQIIFS